MNLVKKIIEDVKKNGDKVVRKYTAVFDKAKLENFIVSEFQFIEIPIREHWNKETTL